MIYRDTEGRAVARCGYVDDGEPCAYRAVDPLADIRLCAPHLFQARCEVEGRLRAGHDVSWQSMRPDPMPSDCSARPGGVAVASPPMSSLSPPG